jgi:hypothetical protein
MPAALTFVTWLSITPIRLGGAASGNRCATEYPPDRPIVARQYAFPDIVEPPFHYLNPDTSRPPAQLVP